ncbi:hypothetical protein TorRG33x02_232010 [Trema orientale]|uniref:Uncharacterized protein n=1 Tax=Trema orientale TaxID=63057 RepID=A0A2P5E607_TREOI|nr:hypothetical protein TorRG33x02_232010 [Trema orientale]
MQSEVLSNLSASKLPADIWSSSFGPSSVLVVASTCSSLISGWSNDGPFADLVSLILLMVNTGAGISILENIQSHQSEDKIKQLETHVYHNA